MKVKRTWEAPKLWIMGVEKTQKNPGHWPQPNDVWCGKHKKWHGRDHSKTS